MAQSADTRPEPSLERKAAIAYGGNRDHRGKVRIEGLDDFDLNRTIFKTLEGRAARYVMKKRVAIEVHWDDAAAAQVQKDYDAATEGLQLPAIDPAIVKFMVEECDFDVEHAEGSFLDHLYFGFEYCVKHYPEGSPLVMLLHSILGTGTNTFAMTADKIPALQALIPEDDWVQIEAFPSVLRLLYAGDIRAELRERMGHVASGAPPDSQHAKAGRIEKVTMRRVIDNAEIELTGEQFWQALNYQLVHLVDFLPVANLAAHQNDSSYILFRDLHDLLRNSGQLVANVANPDAPGPATLEGEERGMGGWLVSKIPVGTAEKMVAKSVRRFSEACGHSLEYAITWG